MNTVKAIYPGTFDPLTNGHLDLVARGAKIFDRLVVAILKNSEKAPLFSVAERIEMLTEAVQPFGNVSVATFDGLLVEFVLEQRAQAILRGVRAISDYEYELQMALMNRRLAPQVETVFLMADEKYSYVSSRLIKNVFELGGSVEGLVPETVITRLQARVTAQQTALNRTSLGIYTMSLNRQQILTEAPPSPFVIPSEAEGPAVQRTFPGYCFSTSM